jgi:toxin ParE1/3/4
VSRIVVSRRAQRDLRAIRTYILKDSGCARADALVERILAVCRLYAEQPRAGWSHPDLGEEIRTCRIGAYLVFYRPRADGIDIIRVLHGRRDIAAEWQDVPPDAET